MRVLLFGFFIILFSCNPDNKIETIFENNLEESKWSVNLNDIKGGGKTYELSKNIKFKKVHDFKKLPDHEKVALISFKNQVRIYPYFFTNHFEVINDVFDNKPIAVTYCPLTKSGICFSRIIKNKTYEILASGYLFKDNMVPSDKNQELLWSQMMMSIICKNNSNENIENFNLIETNWGTAKKYFPKAKVYYHEKIELGPTNPVINEIGNDSEYIYGIFNEKIDTEINLFRYNLFEKDITLLTKVFNNKNVIVIGSEEKSFITCYYSKNLSFHIIDNYKFPNILKDNEGNIWNIFGYAVSGKRKGEQLDTPKAYVAQYWAWKSFYSNLKFN